MMLTKDSNYYTSQSSKTGTNFSNNSGGKSQGSQNALSNIYDQLKQANTKLKETHSQANSLPSWRQTDESLEFAQKAASLNRLKEEEMRRLRNEKLEKIRNEMQQAGSLQNSSKDESISTRQHYFQEPISVDKRSSSPKFFGEKSATNKEASSGVSLKPGRETFSRNEIEDSPHKESENNEDYENNDHIHAIEKSDYKSASPNNITVSQNESKYTQVKFYKRQYDRQHAEKLLQDTVFDEIKKLANSKKMSQNSYKIMIGKLETRLSEILLEIDNESRKVITFEQLGRVFNILGLFHTIHYDEEFNLIEEEQFFSGTPVNQKRRYQEMVIHEEVWKLLAEDEDAEYIDTEFMYIFFRIMLDPANLGPAETARILQEYIDKYRRDTQSDYEESPGLLENHELVELVKNFKKLSENYLHYAQIGFLKAKKAEEISQRSEGLTFKPKVSELSQAIDKYHTKKFNEQHPDKDQVRHRSKTPTKRENLDHLLFDLKGMQNTLQGRGDYFTPTNARANNISEYQDVSISDTVKGDVQDERVKLLYKKHAIAEQKKEEKRREKAYEKQDECTFQPSINKYKYNSYRDPADTVERLYRQQEKKKRLEEERSMLQIERESKETEECTFKPQINNTSNYNKQQKMPNGFDKNVIRMRHALEENQRKKDLVHNWSTGENYEKIRKANIKPFSFVRNPREKRDPPFVYIEVNIAPGKTGKIGIHEDDDPRILAKNFSVAFQLSEEMELNLEEIITQQLEDHFNQKQYDYIE